MIKVEGYLDVKKRAEELARARAKPANREMRI